MANFQQEEDREKFYAHVRKRTAEQWRKTYVTTNSSIKEDEEAKKLLDQLKSKPQSPYSINVSSSILFINSII